MFFPVLTIGSGMDDQKISPTSNPWYNSIWRNLSIDKNSIDESRLEQYSTAQNSKEKISKEKINKENNYKYINSSSNGGMGEFLLNDDSSTSSIENNATTENGENSGVNQGAVSSLFNYLNGMMFLIC